MPRFVVLALAALLLAGCGDSGAPPNVPAGAPSARGGEPELKAPAIRLHLASGPVDLKPWTACYGNGCFDGSPPEDLVDVGPTDAVEFSFARTGWSFEATFREAGADCPRHLNVKATKVGSTRFRVEPAGNADSWDVDVFGRGPGGDVITTFRWTTREAGSFPTAATSSLAVLADNDGRLDSYGVELGISDLATTPKTVSARIDVIAENGDRAHLDLGTMPRRRCYSAGNVSWTRPERVAGPATKLRGDTFRYVVHLTLDGETYTGRGTWPTDTNEDITPAVPLTWTPELPVYRG